MKLQDIRPKKSNVLPWVKDHRKMSGSLNHYMKTELIDADKKAKALKNKMK